MKIILNVTEDDYTAKEQILELNESQEHNRESVRITIGNSEPCNVDIDELISALRAFQKPILASGEILT